MTEPPSTAATGFDWRAFLALAERLAQEVEDEAALRSAISRAYYAVFALASRRLREHGCLSQRRDQHTRVWATYRNAGRTACERIGELGFNLLDQRRRADYQDRIGGIPEKQARLALNRARAILDRLDRLDPDASCCPPAASTSGPGSA
jgi:hypothetical protein